MTSQRNASAPPTLESIPFPTAVRGIGNFDCDAAEIALEGAEPELMSALEAKIAEGQFELPHLPSANMKLLEMTNDPETDVGKVERIIAPDLALTAGLLKIANSVTFGGNRQVDTVRAAIVRIGLQGLRSVLYSLSLKSVIFRGGALQRHAEEIWRQSLAVANNARNLAVPLCLDPERTFVLGLLHDVGKIPLLALLRTLAPKDFAFRRPFVGAVFKRFHEPVGRIFTQSWELPEEIVEVAGRHHDYAGNKGYTRSAALVWLAHRQDVFLSTGDGSGYSALANDPAFATLALPAPHRRPLLEAVRASYQRSLEKPVLT